MVYPIPLKPHPWYFLCYHQCEGEAKACCQCDYVPFVVMYREEVSSQAQIRSHPFLCPIVCTNANSLCFRQVWLDTNFKLLKNLVNFMSNRGSWWNDILTIEGWIRDWNSSLSTNELETLELAMKMANFSIISWYRLLSLFWPLITFDFRLIQTQVCLSGPSY